MKPPTPLTYTTRQVFSPGKKTVNAELININTWRKLNKLSVNFSKTNYVIFTNRNNNHKFKINMDEYTLEQTEYTFC